MARRVRFYVVWRGRRTGGFLTWGETELLVNGFSGARFKSFNSRFEAESEFRLGPPEARPRKKTAPVSGLPPADELPF